MMDFNKRQPHMDTPLTTDVLAYDQYSEGTMFEPLFGVSSGMSAYEYGISEFELNKFQPITDATPLFEPEEKPVRSLPKLDSVLNITQPILSCMPISAISQEPESRSLSTTEPTLNHVQRQVAHNAVIKETAKGKSKTLPPKNKKVLNSSDLLEPDLIPDENFDITKFIEGDLDDLTPRRKSAPQTATANSHKPTTSTKRKYSRRFKAGVKRIDMKAKRYITEDDESENLSAPKNNESEDDNIDVETIPDVKKPDKYNNMQKGIGIAEKSIPLQSAVLPPTQNYNNMPVLSVKDEKPVLLQTSVLPAEYNCIKMETVKFEEPVVHQNAVLSDTYNIKLEKIDIDEIPVLPQTGSHCNIKLEPLSECDNVLEAKDIDSLLLKFEASQLIDVLDLNAFPEAVKSDLCTSAPTIPNNVTGNKDYLMSVTPSSSLMPLDLPLTDFIGTEEIHNQPHIGAQNTANAFSMNYGAREGFHVGDLLHSKLDKPESGDQILDELFSDVLSLVDAYPNNANGDGQLNGANIKIESDYKIKEPLQEKSIIANNDNMEIETDYKIEPNVSTVIESPLGKSNSAVIDSKVNEGSLDNLRNANDCAKVVSVKLENTNTDIHMESCLESAEYRSPKRIKLDQVCCSEVTNDVTQSEIMLPKPEQSRATTSSDKKNSFQKLSSNKLKECKIPEDVIARIKKDANRRKPIALIQPVPEKRKNKKRTRENVAAAENTTSTTTTVKEVPVSKKSAASAISITGNSSDTRHNANKQTVSVNSMNLPKNMVIPTSTTITVPTNGGNRILYARDLAMSDKNIKIQILKTNMNSNKPIEATSSSVLLDHSYACMAPVEQRREEVTDPCKRDKVTVIRNQPTIKNADGILMVSLLKNNTIHSAESAQKKKLNLEEYKKRRYMNDTKPKSLPSSRTSSACSSPSPDDETIRKIKLQQRMMLMAEEVLKTTPKSALNNSNEKKVVKPKAQLGVPLKAIPPPKPEGDLQAVTLLSIGVNTDPVEGPAEGLQDIAPILKTRKFTSSSLIVSIVENQVKATACPQQNAKAPSASTEHGEDKTIIYRPKKRIPIATSTVSVQTDLSFISQIKEVQKTVKQLPAPSALTSSRNQSFRPGNSRGSSSRGSSSRASTSSMSSPGHYSGSSSSSSRSPSFSKRRRNNSGSSSSSVSGRQSDDRSSRSSRYSSPHSSSSNSDSNSPDSRIESPDQHGYNHSYAPMHNQIYMRHQVYGNNPLYPSAYEDDHHSPYQQDHRSRMVPADSELVGDAENRCVVFVGNINGFITASDLRRKFARFGRIKRISLHRLPDTSIIGYGFVTYTTIEAAVRAIEHGNDDPSEPMYTLHFGGRRAFCANPYSDLDNVSEDVDFYRTAEDSEDDADDYFKMLSRFVDDRRRIV